MPDPLDGPLQTMTNAANPVTAAAVSVTIPIHGATEADTGLRFTPTQVTWWANLHRETSAVVRGTLHSAFYLAANDDHPGDIPAWIPRPPTGWDSSITLLAAVNTLGGAR